MRFPEISQGKVALRLTAIAACFVGLAACTTVGGSPAEGIGFRQARFAEVAAMRDYRACRDEALLIDEQARSTGASAKYLASARLIERCEAQLGPEAATIAVEERFRTYALAVQNNMKGGDIEKARENLASLTQAFPDQDLYLAGGASFIDTYRVLLGLDEQGATAQFALVNIGGELKTEMRRLRYWKHN